MFGELCSTIIRFFIENAAELHLLSPSIRTGNIGAFQE